MSVINKMKKMCTFVTAVMLVNICVLLPVGASTIMTYYGADSVEGYNLEANGGVRHNYGTLTTTESRLTASSNGKISGDGSSPTPIKTQEFKLDDKAGPSMALKADAANPWGIGGYWQLVFRNNRAYEDMNVYMELCASNKAPGYYKVQYSTNNSVYNDVDMYVGDDREKVTEISIANGSEKNNRFTKVNITIPEGANIADYIWVRINFSRNLSPGGDTIAGATSGTVYLKTLSVTGEPVTGKVNTPVASTERGVKLATADMVTLSTLTTRATIKYELYRGVGTTGTIIKSQTDYTQPFAPFESQEARATGMVTLRAWAVADGLDNSDEINISYTWIGDVVTAFDYDDNPHILKGVVMATNGSYTNGKLTAGAATNLPLVPTFNNGALQMAPKDELSWGEGAYWQIAVPTAGYSNLTFSNNQYSTGQGPKSFKLQYSLNGETFIDIGGNVNAPTAMGVYHNQTQLPQQLDNQPMVYIRLSVYENLTVGGVGLYGAKAGNSYINDIVITGKPTGAPGVVYHEKGMDDTYTYGEQIWLKNHTETPISYNIHKMGVVTDVLTKIVENSSSLPIVLSRLETFNELDGGDYYVEAWSESGYKSWYYFGFGGGKIVEFDYKGVEVNGESSALSATFGTGELTMSPNDSGVTAKLMSDVNYDGVRVARTAENSWGIGGYWKMKFSTKGFSDIRFSAMQYSSNNGARDFALYYSLDDQSYEKISGSEVRATGNMNHSYLAFKLPENTFDKDNVYLKIMINGGETFDGTNFVNLPVDPATGHTNINSIQINGRSKNAWLRPAIFPADGSAIASKQKVSILNTQGDGQVFYSIYKGAGVSGTPIVNRALCENGVYPFASSSYSEGEKVTLVAWNENGAQTSDKSTATFVLQNRQLVSSFVYPVANATLSQYVSNGGDRTATLQFIQNGSPINIGAEIRTPINAPSQLWSMGTGVDNASAWQIALDTRGIENLTFSARQKSTNSAPRDWSLAYSINPIGPFTTIQNSQISLEPGSENTYDDLKQGHLNVQLPKETENQQTLYLRVYVSSNFTTNGNEGFAVNGNTAINDIFIRGVDVSDSISLSQYDYVKPPVYNEIDKTVDVSIRISNASIGPVADYALVVREGNGRIKNVKKIQVESMTVGEYSYDQALDVSDMNIKAGDLLDVMIWNNLNSMNPISTKEELRIKN